MHKAWACTQAIAFPLYAMFGFVGFYYYGVFAPSADFSLQFFDSTAISIFKTYSIIGVILPSVYSQLCLFLKVELQLGVLPTDWWTISNPEENRLPKLPPVVFRFLFRCGVISGYLFVAEALYSVPLGIFSGFTGAVAMTAFSFYLPWLVHWKLHGNEMSRTMKSICLFWGILGIAVAVAGTVTSAQAMGGAFSAAGGIFDFNVTSQCSHNSFFIGKYGGGGFTPDGNGAFSGNMGNGSFYQNFYVPVCSEDKSIIQCAQLNSNIPAAACTSSQFL